MNKVIRNHDGLYFKHDGEWTKQFDLAETFADTVSAISASKRFHLEDVDLVIIMQGRPDAQWDVVLPLTQ